ncbi:MAG: carboxymuconolactone decarboxylase family protein [Caulobacteraceae bacterium]|nr:carboxymuconolactone decarboxylase family protein [Caulobacteraceae bacterium]
MSRVVPMPRTDAPCTALWHGLRPQMSAAAEALSRAVYQETRLSFRVAEGARMRIAQINGCLGCNRFRLEDDLPRYLAQMDEAGRADFGADRGPFPPEEFYQAVADWRVSPLFSDRERLAIEYAERIAESPRDLPYDDAFWTRMHGQFTEAEIVDLTYSITGWIATGRFVHVLGFDGSCPIEPAAQHAAE